MDPRNEAVLRHLEVERVASPDTNTAWVIDGYEGLELLAALLLRAVENVAHGDPPRADAAR